MLPTISSRDAYRVPFDSIGTFLLISFGLAWGIVGLYVFLPERMEAVFGQITGNHPLFYLAVYSPAIGAFTVSEAQPRSGEPSKVLSDKTTGRTHEE